MTNHRVEATADLLRSHLESFWPDHKREEFVWTIGPIAKALPDFRVCRVAPGDVSIESWNYVSIGAWEVPTDEYRIEFLIIASESSAIHVETLAMVANFHADVRHRLDLGSIVNIGRPWVEGSALTHLLVSLPYAYGPGFETCIAGSLIIRFLWLLPITSKEADYARAYGVDALERRFEELEIEFLDPTRASVV